MGIALVIAGGLLGVTAVPHCAAMCGAPCAAIIGRHGRPRRRELVFHAGRAGGYAAAGAVAATGLGAIAALGQRLHALQPVWSLMHAAALALGLWLLLRGAVPAFRLAAWGAPAPTAAGARPIRWMTARAGAAGAIWFAWPCGVLQAALLVAALASDPVAGAGVMLAFAATSSAACGR
jgi:sulfite exporter TauE/SafE